MPNGFYYSSLLHYQKKYSLPNVNQVKYVPNKFLVFELNRLPTTIGPYTLSEHHLSIYKTAVIGMSPQAKKSQYHYTATFSDKDSNECTLHIYYDAEDTFKTLSFKINNRNHSCVELQEDFKILASQAVDGLITKLRNTHQKLITSLIKKYNQLEKRCSELSRDLITNKTALLIINEKLVSILKKLEKYDTRSVHSSLISQFEARRISLPPPMESSSLQQEEEEEKEDASPSRLLESTKIEEQAHAPMDKTGKPEALIALQKRMKRINQHPSVAKIVNFLALLHIERSKNWSEENKAILMSLQKKINELTQTIILNILQSQDTLEGIEEGYNTALSQLTPYYPIKEYVAEVAVCLNKPLIIQFLFDRGHMTLNNEWILKIAISHDKPLIIQFLFDKGYMAIDKALLFLEGKLYHSLIHYCFNNPYGINHAVQACFKLIINSPFNQAQLLAIDETSKLPFIFSLFIDKKYSPLLLHINGRLPRDFYIRLLLILEAIPCTHSNRADIHSVIVSVKYILRMDSIMSISPKETEPTYALLINEFKKNKSDEYWSKIELLLIREYAQKKLSSSKTVVKTEKIEELIAQTTQFPWIFPQSFNEKLKAYKNCSSSEERAAWDEIVSLSELFYTLGLQRVLRATTAVDKDDPSKRELRLQNTNRLISLIHCCDWLHPIHSEHHLLIINLSLKLEFYRLVSVDKEEAAWNEISALVQKVLISMTSAEHTLTRSTAHHLDRSSDKKAQKELLSSTASLTLFSTSHNEVDDRPVSLSSSSANL